MAASPAATMLPQIIARLEACLPVLSRPATDVEQVDKMMPAIHAVHTALHFGMVGAATPANQRAAER